VVVHRDELVRQAENAFKEVGPDVPLGVIQGPRKGCGSVGVCIATVQSLARKLGQLPPDAYGLVVVDEAHHIPASSWSKVADHLRPRFLLGVTATPTRLDSKPLGTWFGEEPLFEYRLENAIRDGVLVPLRQRLIQTEIDLDGVQARKGGDFATAALSRVVATEARNRVVVEA